MIMDYAFPFDSKVDASGKEDREYFSAHMRDYFSKFVSNGVFGANTTELLVTHVSGMRVSLSHGYCFIKGAVKEVPKTEFTLDYGDESAPRIDTIVLRYDLNERDITPILVKGTATAEALPPTPQRSEEVWDLVVATIHVGIDSAELSQSSISDERGTSWCPYVTGLVQGIDTSGLFAQYQAAWNEFIEQLGDSDHVTINTEDRESRKQVTQVREQMPFGSMFMVV